MEFNIYPNIKKSITIVKARYAVFNYVPFTSANVSVQFFDADDLPIETKVYEINVTNGFNDWGTDDKFLEAWIKQQIYN